ncbi:MAG: PEP-CTERM sorting domain-containing protein [Gammaproteobacteria bacterium]
MKRILPLILTAACLSSTVYAQPIFLDVSAATTQSTGSLGLTPGFGGDADTFTSVFGQLALFAQTTTTQYDTNLGGVPGLNIGDRFLDFGHAVVTDLLPPLGDDEAIGFLSEITVAWTGLSGVTTSDLVPAGALGEMTQNFAYDPMNTTFSFYFHGDAAGPAGGPNSNFGTNIGAFDNTGMADGQKIMEIKITGGHGNNTFDSGLNFLTGSSVLFGEITYALQDFWWFDNGNFLPGTPGDMDFADLLGMVVPITLKTSIDQNTDAVELDASIAGVPGPAGFGNALFNVNSSHDGSIDFKVTVPEPGTLLLLGLGLVAFPGLRRKLLAKKSV